MAAGAVSVFLGSQKSAGLRLSRGWSGELLRTDSSLFLGDAGDPGVARSAKLWSGSSNSAGPWCDKRGSGDQGTRRRRIGIRGRLELAEKREFQMVVGNGVGRIAVWTGEGLRIKATVR